MVCFGIKKINDCINPKFEIFTLTNSNLDDYNKVVTLPLCISTLIVRGYTHPTLPSNLPSELKILECHSQSLQNLPENLPNGLIKLNCSVNQLTSLPDKLPDGLEELYCSDTLITAITNLPNGLKQLYCLGNKHLLKFPDKLPDTLQVLYCDVNHFPLTKMSSNLTHIVTPML